MCYIGPPYIMPHQRHASWRSSHCPGKCLAQTENTEETWCCLCSRSYGFTHLLAPKCKSTLCLRPLITRIRIIHPRNHRLHYILTCQRVAGTTVPLRLSMKFLTLHSGRARGHNKHACTRALCRHTATGGKGHSETHRQRHDPNKSVHYR